MGTIVVCAVLLIFGVGIRRFTTRMDGCCCWWQSPSLLPSFLWLFLRAAPMGGRVTSEKR
jgi:hypothetical protein